MNVLFLFFKTYFVIKIQALFLTIFISYYCIRTVAIVIYVQTRISNEPSLYKRLRPNTISNQETKGKFAELLVFAIDDRRGLGVVYWCRGRGEAI